MGAPRGGAYARRWSWDIEMRAPVRVWASSRSTGVDTKASQSVVTDLGKIYHLVKHPAHPVRPYPPAVARPHSLDELVLDRLATLTVN